MKQTDRVLQYMKENGSITSLDAIRELGNTRLAATIHILRNSGHDIDSNMVSRKNRFGEDCTVAKYTFAVKKGQLGLF